MTKTFLLLCASVATLSPATGALGTKRTLGAWRRWRRARRQGNGTALRRLTCLASRTAARMLPAERLIAEPLPDGTR